MMIKLFLVFFSICVSSITLAQNGDISGKVIDAITNEPLQGANVFITGSTRGTSTNHQGDFSLIDIPPGRYEMIISLLGYVVVHTTAIIDRNAEKQLVKLQKKAIELSIVTIVSKTSSSAREKNYSLFQKSFIGHTINSERCRILNPDVLNLLYNDNRKVLQASSEQFLIIENNGLGYRLKYLLTDFALNTLTGELYFAGPLLFEEMTGDRSKVRKWTENRRKAYLGSAMHFFRTLASISDSLVENGFIVHKLKRVQNTARPADSVISAKINEFRQAKSSTAGAYDSIRYWQAKFKLPKMFDLIARDTVKTPEIVSRRDKSDYLALSFNDYLHITYTKQKTSADTYKNYDKPQHPVSIISSKGGTLYFNRNGVITRPDQLVYEDEWAQGVAEILPVDYDPGS